MNLTSTIVRIFAVVDRALRREFPDDYDKRCMYAASATCLLLQETGHEAHIYGGDVVAFVVSKAGDRAGLQGFGGGTNQSSHFWVKTGNVIVDIGPHYLPRGSSFPAAMLPFVAWNSAIGLPKYLRYRVKVEYDLSVQRLATPDSAMRNEEFIDNCRKRFKVLNGQPKLPGWLLTDQKSIETAAIRGDLWARNAICFSELTTEDMLPF